jgi:hypothetical protein
MSAFEGEVDRKALEVPSIANTKKSVLSITKSSTSFKSNVCVC